MKSIKTRSVSGMMNPCGGKRDFRFTLLAGLLALQLLPGSLSVQAQEEDEHYGPRPAGQAKSQERDKAAREANAGNADVLVLPGLVANRKTRQVEVLAECTGLGAGTELEFLLVDKDSSHGYEALLWSHAKPSDVHKALEFIGLKAGSPFNPSALRFWADGDRVNLRVSADGGIPVPIEEMVLDNETETTLPEEGFVFTGSMMVSSPDGKGAQVYAADAYDPRSVASIYNEQTAVLDVPRQANKGELYGRQVVNPECAFEGGTLLTILMEPGESGRSAPTPRVELSLLNPVDATGVVFRLSGAEDKVLAESPVLVPVLEQLTAMRKQDIAPQVKLHMAGELPLGEILKPAVSLVMMETLGMIRMEPPADGQLYYRAFVPQKEWMQPEGRPSQPWELHLRLQEAGKVAAEIVLNEPVWSGTDPRPTFTRRVLGVAEPKDLREQLDADAQVREAGGKAPLPGVLLVFVPPELTYGALLAFLQPVLGTHGTIYVFVQ